MTKMLKRDFVGKLAKLTRDIKTVGGSILDAGEIVKIFSTHRGRFRIQTTTKCKHCYRRHEQTVSQVSENDLELVDTELKTHFVAVHVTSRTGDWQGMYVNGKLSVQGHSIGAPQVLDAFGIRYEHREIDMDPYTMSRLPEKLQELPE